MYDPNSLPREVNDPMLKKLGSPSLRNEMKDPKDRKINFEISVKNPTSGKPIRVRKYAEEHLFSLREVWEVDAKEPYYVIEWTSNDGRVFKFFPGDSRISTDVPLSRYFRSCMKV